MPYLKQKSKIYIPFKDSNGMILVTGLMFMAILSVLSTTAYLFTSNEIKASLNYKSSKKALYAAEAGIEEARSRLRGLTSSDYHSGDPALNPDPWWSSYIITSSSWDATDDPYYDTNYHNYIPIPGSHTNTNIMINSFQTDISYFVMTRYKKEYDAEQAGHTTASPHYYDDDGSQAVNSKTSPGSIIYYGYKNDSSQVIKYFTTINPNPANASPVKLIRAYSANEHTKKIIEIEVMRDPGPVIHAALYAKGHVTGDGNNLNIDGSDYCSMSSSIFSIYTQIPYDTILSDYNPTSVPVQGADDVNIEGVINRLKKSANMEITDDQDGEFYGADSDYVICYSDASSNMQGLRLENTTGYGMLLIEGDLSLRSGFNWNGLILITGILTMLGDISDVNIYGAVLANEGVVINGTINIKYDSCEIENSLRSQPLRIISWKEIH
ncbi:Pilus assembly PilX N-terminal domain-containing protein [Candidatus Magnetomoraceae bacterium gMMP-15]